MTPAEHLALLGALASVSLPALGLGGPLLVVIAWTLWRDWLDAYP